MDDLELARRLAAGEPGALEILTDRHLDAVFRFLRHLTRRQEDAEDLAQQTVLRAIWGAGRFDGRAPMRSWLLAIAFREFTRWRRRRLWLPLSSDPVAPDAFGPILDAEALLGAISRLSDRHRAAFLLHYVEELSVAEAAAVQGVPEGTLKRWLHEARAELRETLGKEEAHYEPC